jgi:hypothetical protein
METESTSAFPSLPSRLVQVFFSPGELFTALRGNPAWFGALTVGAVLVALSMFLVPGEIWTQTLREQSAQGGGQEMPEWVWTLIRFVGPISSALGHFISAFVMAGVVCLVFRFFFGDEGGYKQYLSVVCHALVITALGGLLLTPLRIMQETIDVRLSVGTFFSFLEEGYPLRVLRMFELFGLWAMMVMAIGVTKIDPRRSFGSALTFFSIFAVGTALIFGIFQPPG